MAAATKEELGPTLPELVRPLWRQWGRRRRIGVIVAALVVLLAIFVLVERGRGKEFSYGGSAETPAFSFRYQGMQSSGSSFSEQLVHLDRNEGGDLIRTLIAEPVALPSASNPIATTLPFAARAFDKQAAETHAGYRKIVEGWTRLNVVDGKEAYMIGFTATGAGPDPDGNLWMGKTFLIPEPGPQPHRAVALELLERVQSADVAAAIRDYPAGFFLNWPSRFWVQQRTSVDIPGELERPLKTFSFG
jgi:hypothetical protein